MSTLRANHPSIPKSATAAMSHLASFLSSRTSKPASTLNQATPMDIVEYLVFKEINGRTQYHGQSCRHAGSARPGHRIIAACSTVTCPIRAAPGSISTCVSLLRTGFGELGLTTAWDPSTGYGNPATSDPVDAHIERLQKEAGGSLITPVQAAPLSPDFILRLQTAVFTRLSDPRTPGAALTWRQFWLFALLVGASGRRPGDLVRIRTPSLLWLPDKARIVVTMVVGKTATTRQPDRFIIDDNRVINALHLYTRECRWAGKDLTQGSPYLFFALSAHGLPTEDHASAATMTARFQSTLRGMGVFEGETLYGFRVGAAVAARIDTGDVDAVLAAGGWRSRESAARYSQFAIVAEAAADADAPVDAVRAWLQTRKDFAVFA